MKSLVAPVLFPSNGVAKKPAAGNSVLSTTDYKIFKKITGNRDIDPKHVNNLKKSIEEHDLMIPIIVNEKNEVIDGSHRLEARKELGLPVPYVVVKGLTITDTQKANLNNKNWRAGDFLNFYVTQDFEHYKVLNDFINKYKLSIQVAAVLLAGHVHRAKDIFNSGEFAVTDLKKATKTMDKIYLLKPYYKGFKRRSFIYAMMNVFSQKTFDFDEFLNKVSYQSRKLVDCTNIEQYLHLIEEIYNYKRRGEEKVRFTK